MSERFAAKLESLVQYVQELKDQQATGPDAFLGNTMLRRGVERTLQLAVEAAIDLGTMCVAARRWRAPETNRDVFRVLTENGVVDQGLGARLERMAGFRNVLVHEYTRVDPEIVFSVLHTGLPDLEGFVAAVRAFVLESGQQS